MITTESTQSRKRKALNAGRDYALGSNDESCLGSQHFIPEMNDAWLEGYEQEYQEEAADE